VRSGLERVGGGKFADGARDFVSPPFRPWPARRPPEPRSSGSGGPPGVSPPSPDAGSALLPARHPRRRPRWVVGFATAGRQSRVSPHVRGRLRPDVRSGDARSVAQAWNPAERAAVKVRGPFTMSAAGCRTCDQHAGASAGSRTQSGPRVGRGPAATWRERVCRVAAGEDAGRTRREWRDRGSERRVPARVLAGDDDGLRLPPGGV
jgi:hypothetical protein